MRTELICRDRTVTFANLLTKDIRKVATYLNVNEIKQRATQVYCKKMFPNYSHLLIYRIQKGKDLAKLLNAVYCGLHVYLGKTLPQTFLIQILEYMNEKNLQILKAIG